MENCLNTPWLAKSLLDQLETLTGNIEGQAQAIFDEVITSGGTWAEPGTNTSWAADINWTICLYGVTAMAPTKEKAIHDWMVMAKRTFKPRGPAVAPRPQTRPFSANTLQAGAVYASR